MWPTGSRRLVVKAARSSFPERTRQTGDDSAVRTIVLVEGTTDKLALTLAAERSGRNLEAEGVTVLPINGAHAIGGILRQLAVEQPAARLAGLYDEGEQDVIRSALERAGYGSDLDDRQMERLGFFACRADLEDELIRAVDETTLSRLIAAEGDTQPWHTFRNQPAWNGRPLDQQFRRFIRSVSERNSRYIRAIIETIEPSRLPPPLQLLLNYIDPGSHV